MLTTIDATKRRRAEELLHQLEAVLNAVTAPQVLGRHLAAVIWELRKA